MSPPSPPGFTPMFESQGTHVLTKYVNVNFLSLLLTLIFILELMIPCSATSLECTRHQLDGVIIKVVNYNRSLSVQSVKMTDGLLIFPSLLKKFHQ